MNSRRGESGQALIESVVSIFTLSTFAICGLTVAYLLFTRMWLEYQLDQSVICLATTGSSSRCMNRLQERADAFLPFGIWHGYGVAERTQFVVKGHFELAGKVDWKWQKVLDVENLGMKKAHSRGF